MKFVCDNTVGRLARLLRMAGFDTEYVSEDDLPAVVSISREQSRTIISRNSRFADLVLAADFYHVQSDDFETQFVTLIRAFDLYLDESQFLTRCLDCNQRLEQVDKEDVKNRVWPYVWDTQEEFFTCPGCLRIYWQATHVRAMYAFLMRLKHRIEAS